MGRTGDKATARWKFCYFDTLGEYTRGSAEVILQTELLLDTSPSAHPVLGFIQVIDPPDGQDVGGVVVAQLAEDDSVS